MGVEGQLHTKHVPGLDSKGLDSNFRLAASDETLHVPDNTVVGQCGVVPLFFIQVLLCAIQNLQHFIKVTAARVLGRSLA